MINQLNAHIVKRWVYLFHSWLNDHYIFGEFHAFRSPGALINHTIICQAGTDLIENGRLEEEAPLFVEPPLDGFPDDGEEKVRFDDIVKDPLEL